LSRIGSIFEGLASAGLFFYSFSLVWLGDKPANPADLLV
jgi:hypothetical protein